MDWKLTDANGRLKEVVALATQDGPQLLTQGRDVVAVVLSKLEYERLTHTALPSREDQPQPDFLKHLLSIPKVEELVLERNKSTTRRLDFGEE